MPEKVEGGLERMKTMEFEAAREELGILTMTMMIIKHDRPKSQSKILTFSLPLATRGKKKKVKNKKEGQRARVLSCLGWRRWGIQIDRRISRIVFKIESNPSGLVGGSRPSVKGERPEP